MSNNYFKKSWVTAHTGIRANEEADALDKQAVLNASNVIPHYISKEISYLKISEGNYNKTMAVRMRLRLLRKSNT